MKIGIIIPSTSNKSNYTNINDYYFFNHTLKSIYDTVSNNHQYTFYIGYDKGDSFFKDHNKIKQKFDEITENKNNFICNIYEIENISKGNPCFIWNSLFKIAYDDNSDYFLQTGDAINFKTSNWDTTFINELQKNNNIGMVGGYNNNYIIITQTFVSRKHMDIFGTYFPKVFKNWWSDDWINYVYMDLSKNGYKTENDPENKNYRYWIQNIKIDNNVINERYDVHQEGFTILKDEIINGKQKLEIYLKNNPTNNPIPTLNQNVIII